MMEYAKWILLAVCLISVMWPLISKQPSDHNKESKPQQKDQ
jgi:hypothetical protein